MADFYKILKADALGDPYTPNVAGAKPIQSYWCQVEGQDKAVMIGKQVRDDGQPALHAGQHVYGDLMYAKSQKGNEYWKLKSAMVPEGVQRPADSPAQAQAQQATGGDVSGAVPGWFSVYGSMIEFVYKEMKAMSDTPDHKAEEATAQVEPTAQVEQVAGEPLDEETQKTLDDIFGAPEPTEPTEA